MIFLCMENQDIVIDYACHGVGFTRGWQIYFMTLIFRARDFTSVVDRTRKKRARKTPFFPVLRPIENHLESYLFALYYLIRASSFYMECISIESFYNEALLVSGSHLNVVWMSKIRCLSDVFASRCAEEYAESIELYYN